MARRDNKPIKINRRVKVTGPPDNITIYGYVTKWELDDNYNVIGYRVLLDDQRYTKSMYYSKEQVTEVKP